MFTEYLTRGNEFKLHQGSLRLGIRENFLTVRMVQHQRALPEGLRGPHHWAFSNLRKADV